MLQSVTSLSHFFSTHPLTRDAPLRAWARFASWQVKSRLHDEILFPWIDGQKLAVRAGMTGATGNIYAGLHEFADMMVPLHFLREGDLFLDVGANIGSYTILASGVCRAKTWSFEPDPNTAAKLRRNVAVNNLGDLVTVHEFALGPEKGEVRFTAFPAHLDCINKVASDNDQQVRVVRQERLDDVVGDAEPTMIKMDVEGYEEQALGGAQDLLRKPSLKVVELETVSPEIERMMVGARFERVYYDPFGRRLAREPVGPKANNSLFIRDWPFVEARLKLARKIEVLGHSI